MTKLIMTIDVGNTTIQLGVFSGDQLISDWRFSTMKEKTSDEIGCIFLSAFSAKNISADNIKGIAISCVVPSLINRFRDMCSKYFKCIPIEIEPGCKNYLPTKYPKPEQIGADRIVNAVAACEKYGYPLIIIDFGTATTFCAISSKGEFMGGCIVPGIGISLETLVQSAERLSHVSWERPKTIIAKNTNDAIRSGIYFGYASLVDGIVQRMKKELGDDPKIVATGGWSSVIAEQSHSINIVDPYLTLDGLRIIYDREESNED